MKQTTLAKFNKNEKKWYLIDATGMILGRMATQIAIILRGKNKPNFTPYIDGGDNVIVINADKIILTGDKWNKKNYYSHSQYPGGLKITNAKKTMEKKPCYMVEHAVRLMLPKGILGRQIYNNLHVYEGSKHPHEAQKPINLLLKKKGVS